MSDFERMAPKQSVAVLPLTKGMFRDKPSQHIEDGGFWTIKNAVVSPQGLLRRPAFYTIADEDEFRGQAIYAVTWTTSTDIVKELLVTSAGVYSISKLAGLTSVPFSFTEGTVTTTDGDTISKASGTTDWTDATDWDEVWPGDFFVLDSNGTAVEIATVSDATTITLASTYPVTSFTGAAYTILRGFRVADERAVVSTVMASNRAVFLSRFSPPVEITVGGDALEVLQSADGNTVVNEKLFSATCGAFFNERLFLGHITEWDGGAFVEYRQRIRFSTVTDFGKFDAASNGNYVDLSYTRGAIQAIAPLGNLLVIYLEDAIYFGYGSPNANQPLVFEQVETGGIGLVGSRAFVPYEDGHFFVGQDNMHFLTTRGLQPVGDPVLAETVRKCMHKWRIIATTDPRRNRVLFGFPTTDKNIANVWSFEYSTGAWSYEDYATWMVASTLFDDSLGWSDLTASTWTALDATWPTWADMQAEADTEISLLREFSGMLQIASRGAREDDVAGPIEVQLESKDHDLSVPDLEKCWTRLAVKLRFENDIAFDSALDFTCEVSHNRGRTWKNVGRLRIRAGMDEGHCDFRLTSSTFRFRLTSSAATTPYTVTEYTYNVTPLARESHLGSQEG